MDRKWLFLTMALLVSLLPLAGCAAPTPQVVVQKETVTVRETVMVQSSPALAEGLGETKDAYVFPEGSVLLTPQPDLIAKFQLKPDYKASRPLNIVFITKHLLAPYFVAGAKGFEKRCQELGVNGTVYAPEKPDNPEEQIRMIEDAVNKKVDGIVIYAVDSKAVSPAVKKAEEAGIPVVGLGTIPFGSKLVTFISADYYTRSYDLAKLLAEKVGGKGTFVTIDGVPGAQNAKDMWAGYMDALKEYPGIQVVASQTGYWKRLEGQKAMENILQRFPDITAVVGADDESALGAILAMEAAGLDPKKVPVIGFNASHDGLCAIKAGRMFASDDADPGGLSAAGAEVLVRSILDKEQFPPEIPWPLPEKKFYVTTENVMEFWPRAYGLSDEEKALGECIN